MSSSKGRLFVLSGPSGTGKSTICREVSKRTGIECSLSATTRQPRDGEQDGVHYIFLSREEFNRRASEGWFYEHEEVYGELYGTPRGPIDEGLEMGKDFLLDIDIQGAESVRRDCKYAVLIFIAPPDMEELRRRLEDRATESQADVELRMSRSADEMSRQESYDHTVLNTDLEQAVEDVGRIVRTEKANGRV